ncbi:MAG: DUF4153 domain-containing protein [Phenylobacterium sp.]|uniref:DUF4153 domain-containing protein n=1 Tax=Brevundimonas sp. TaxID=1871086 RepID=UPI00273781D2|nr:DUF4153 domain-containing protein [Brevundimonas sp.]MDP3800825.1 DUF4153 domain-containing protein [Brevundimonas sp.]MDZ4372520.1 DUF4153 domain-containing protein [Phenylobacterium sp.]
MTDASESTGRDGLGASPAAFGALRIGVGLLQGLGLYWLHRASDGGTSWGATHPLLFGPLLLVVGFLPLVLLAGVGRLRPVTMVIWTVVAGVVLALLGLHDIARQSADTLQGPPFLSPQVILFSAAALFIAHHLVAPADMERRRIASYPAYFDTATKAAVQLALSAGFTGAFWILLHLGAALFRIINLDFLENLLREPWFAIPVTGLVFAAAVHLTDVRDGLIRGVRTVALMLLSWLLLVITVLVGGFLAALPFTGLGGLWETGSGVSLVLAAAAALIILINAAYQDGQPDNRPPFVLRAAVRVAAVLITPLIVIAFWGLALRIGQYGLTPDRIIAAACALVGASFAAGYGWAALSPFWRKGDWMRPLERTTIWTAVLTVAVILLLFSPVLDPSRLSVMDQVARLERGAVTPDKFDYAFLRFESGKAGQAALARLTRSTNAAVAAEAVAAQKIENRYDARPAEEDLPVPTIEIWPVGAAPLPAGIIASANRYDLRDCQHADPCLATRRDLNGDGTMEILIAGHTDVWVFIPEGDGWSLLGFFRQRCRGDRRPDPRVALRAGRLRAVQPVWPDLVFADGRQVARFHSDDIPDCESAPVVTAPTPPPPVTDVGGPAP